MITEKSIDALPSQATPITEKMVKSSGSPPNSSPKREVLKTKKDNNLLAKQEETDKSAKISSPRPIDETPAETNAPVVENDANDQPWYNNMLLMVAIGLALSLIFGAIMFIIKRSLPQAN